MVRTLDWLGFHAALVIGGAIFLMPKGRADAFKKELVAAGAHASPAIVPEVPAKTDAKEKK